MNDRGLIVPPKASADSSAVEILRCWVTGDGGLQCSLQPAQWEDPRSWGIALADIANHVAQAIAKDRGTKVEETLSGIRAVFNAEMVIPTDAPTGEFVK